MNKALVAVLVLLGACQAAIDATPVDPANATYTLDKRTVTLSSGSFEEPVAPGSAARSLTKLTDKRAAGDIDGDGRQDAAVVLTSSGGGSGVFSYVVVLLGTGGGKGTASNAILLGDRIAVDAVRVESGKVVVDMLQRRPGEPFAAAPSVRVTRTFEVRSGALAELK